MPQHIRYVDTLRSDSSTSAFQDLHLSAYEVKNNCCLFERFFKVKKNGICLFEISFFVLEILTFLYYANEESDGVINGYT